MRKKERELIDEFEEQLQKKREIPEKVRKDINKNIFANLLILFTIIFLNILFIFGFYNIDRDIYLKDLKIFSITTCIISILIFEKSYKKGSGKICLWGIEILIFALTILFCTYICILQENRYILYLAIVSYIFTMYYLIKDIKIYKRIKKHYIKSLSDINDIVKKQEPVKKQETSKKRR